MKGAYDVMPSPKAAARLTAEEGPKTRALLKILGRSALVVAGLGAAAIGWLFAIAGYALGVAMLCQRIGFWPGRRL